MSRLTWLIPWLVVTALALMAAAPLGLGSDGRLMIALLPLVAIVHFTAGAPDRTPAALAFTSGLALDVLSHGPLGYWCCVYLVGFLSTQALTALAGPGLGRRAMMLAGVTAAVVVSAWVVSSLYVMRPADWRPLIAAGLAMLCLYPLIALLLRPLQRIGQLPPRINLERGG